MPTTQRPKMVRHTVQIVLIWRYLRPRVIQRNRRAPATTATSAVRHLSIHARRERRRHVIRQIEAL